MFDLESNISILCVNLLFILCVILLFLVYVRLLFLILGVSLLSLFYVQVYHILFYVGSYYFPFMCTSIIF